MKKKFSLLMAVLMLAMLLAGCGGDKPADSNAGGGDSADSSAPADSGASAVAEDTNTVAVGAVVIARDDVPEDDIYALTSAIFENIPTITEQHAKGGELDLDFASSVTSVPYHPGAAKYFAEKGKEVASVKEGAGSGDSKALTFGTGGESGTYYAFGGVLSSYISNNTGVSVTALYMEQVQIVTTNPDIKSVADLAGKSVSIGDRGSGVWFNAVDVLGAYDIDPDSGISPVYQGFGDSADSLKDKKIDAAFVVAGAPTTAIVDLATSGPVYLVSLDEEHTSALLESSPYYSAYTIPAGTY